MRFELVQGGDMLRSGAPWFAALAYCNIIDIWCNKYIDIFELRIDTILYQCIIIYTEIIDIIDVIKLYVTFVTKSLSFNYYKQGFSRFFTFPPFAYNNHLCNEFGRRISTFSQWNASQHATPMLMV